MASFRSFDRPDGQMGAEGEYSEMDEYEGKMNGMVNNEQGFGGGGGGGEFEGGGKPGAKISEWQAGWNVTNAIQGMFIVSLPYSVLHGGYWGVGALVFVAYVCCYTGKILVDCLYETNERGEKIRVRDSYVAIAEECLGQKYGGKLVNIAQIIELLMTCILYVVLCGDLLIGSFPDGTIDQRSWMMVCTMLLFSCAFLTDLGAVSTLSFWCTVTHIIINVIIFGYCFINIFNWQWSKVTFRLDVQTFPIMLGIVVFSYTSQIFLPGLEGSMRDPSKFQPMLDWSHIAAAAFKGLFAYVGFMTFGDETQEVITNNLPSQGFKNVVNMSLVIKALLSYPLPYYAAVNLLESAFFRGKPTDQRPDGEGVQPFHTCWARDNELRVWAVALRVLLVLFIMFMAISIPHFAILMGLVGNFTGTMLSFVWPCLFHMKLKWSTMDFNTITWEVFIICFGSFCGIIGIFTSFSALIDAYHLPLPYPGPHPVQG
ncbi:vesicular inhibitory amino acid transporter-like [Oppia nitens]|uniref:vesicular inhibitory amino acid transporter-like n=1 Tax=Oppia nitens TaxID=1686743 RepID=UPI0023DA12FB|nr:vesicular inhibitory amino acid transporter-like [Oppia nitens]